MRHWLDIVIPGFAHTRAHVDLDNELRLMLTV